MSRNTQHRATPGPARSRPTHRLWLVAGCAWALACGQVMAADALRDAGGVAITAQTEIKGLEDSVQGLESQSGTATPGPAPSTDQGQGSGTGTAPTDTLPAAGTTPASDVEGGTGTESGPGLRIDINALDDPLDPIDEGSKTDPASPASGTGETPATPATGATGNAGAGASGTTPAGTGTTGAGTDGSGASGSGASGSGASGSEATGTNGSGSDTGGTTPGTGSGNGTGVGSKDPSAGTGPSDGKTPIPGSVRNPVKPAEDSTALLAGGAAGGLVLVAIIVWLAVRRRRSGALPGEPAPAPVPVKEPAAAPPAARPVLPQAARPRAILRDLTGSTERTEHVLEADTVQIGRAAAPTGSGVQSVVVMRKTVGRRHAVIEYRNHTYWLVDQGSLNGSYVNGVRVDGEIALRPGASISLESVEFEFVLPDLGDVDEFAETLAVDASVLQEGAIAAIRQPPNSNQAAGGAAQLADVEPGGFLETLVNREAPTQGFKPAAPPASGMDTAVDDHDATTPVSEEERAAAKQAAAGTVAGTGTVDFDVFGDADDQPEGGKPEGGLIDSYRKD